MNRAVIFVSGIAATLAWAGLWHGPLGAGDRLAARAETVARRHPGPLRTARRVGTSRP